jgi:hypothetical protein
LLLSSLLYCCIQLNLPIYAHFAGQTSESTCLPCSSSQSCPEGTSNPTLSQSITTWQIVTYVLSAIGSVIGILVSVFKIYPAIKSRIAKLREAGIKPTLKRVIFLQAALSKYAPLLHPSERASSFQAVSSEKKVALGARVRVTGSTSTSDLNGRTGVVCGDLDSATGRWTVRLDSDNSVAQLLPHNLKLESVALRGYSESIVSVSGESEIASAPPALLSLTAKQLGHLVCGRPSHTPMFPTNRNLHCRSQASAPPTPPTANSLLITTLLDTSSPATLKAL